MAKGRKGSDGDDAQVELLRAIWNEMKGLNGRVDQTNSRLDQTNERLGALERGQSETNDRLEETNDRLDESIDRLGTLERRETESELRLASELVAVAKAVNEVRDLLREHVVLAPRVDDHERRLATLERKLG
jgi:septal ring factor EnvC (AmiA/AmiB activator)